MNREVVDLQKQAHSRSSFLPKLVYCCRLLKVVPQNHDNAKASKYANKEETQKKVMHYFFLQMYLHSTVSVYKSNPV